MISRIRAVFLRYLYELPGLDMMAGLFFWPVIDILLWGLAIVWIQQRNHDPQLPQLILTALILFHVFVRGAVDLAYFLLLEFWNRSLVSLFATPIRLIEWLAGMVSLSALKVLLSIAFGSSVAYFFYGVNVFSSGLIFLFYASSLLISGWSLGMFTASIIFRHGQKMGMLAWLFPNFFFPISAVFYPVSNLPEWVQPISWALPMTYIFEAVRSNSSLVDLTHNLLLNTLYFAAAAAIFKIAFERSRTRGLNRLE